MEIFKITKIPPEDVFGSLFPMLIQIPWKNIAGKVQCPEIIHEI
jgi:hypothetical protein